ncbi:interleukin-36 gamma-like [Suncus etruscus]|uniref:interleukin-36 gamma-like n=1 Tax=Suncus etruscus TaxID=109475 RepID=UPI00210F9C46|nr:interleukin-36 gamma-like [Suncus etruscus]
MTPFIHIGNLASTKQVSEPFLKHLSRPYREGPLGGSSCVQDWPEYISMSQALGKPQSTVVMGKSDVGEIFDLNQNVWIFQDENLISIPRRRNVKPVMVAIMPCKHPVFSEQNFGFPIYLGIKNPEKCLSCEEIEGKTTLQLKDKNILDLYNAPEPVIDFLFYRNQDGRTSTFESVAFPGWFIASSDKGQPLFLTSNPGGTDNIAFIYKASDLY